MRKIFFVKISFLVLCCVLSVSFARAQTVTSFSYQGKLNDGGVPANGQFDFLFKLYQTGEGGAQIGADFVRDDVPVTNGVFSTIISFGTAPFTSMTGFYVEIWVRPGASAGAYTPLAPRMALQTTPYSLKSFDSSLLGGVAAGDYVLTGDSRLSDARNPLPNSTNYIQNRTTTQASTNFNISGNGTVGGVLSANRAEIGPGSNFGYQFFVHGQGAAFRVENSTNEGTLASFGSNGYFMIDGGGFSGMRMSLNPSGDVGFGTHAALYKLEVIDASNRGLRVQTNTAGGTVASFGGSGKFQIDAPSSPGGRLMVLEDGSVGIGTGSPAARLHVTGSGLVRARINSNDNAGLALTLNDQPGWSLATVTGGQFQIFNDAAGQNAVWINTANNVGIGTTAPQDRLDVNGIIRFSGLGSAGGVALCRNAFNQISNCSSSLRYKSNINDFRPGLDLIGRLRSVSFNWKEGGSRDLGFVAEEVARVEPLLVTKNERGEIEGVKYDRLGVVLVNAVQEQQRQIEQQQKIIDQLNETIKKQQTRLDALETFLCAQNAAADFCKPKN